MLYRFNLQYCVQVRARCGALLYWMDADRVLPLIISLALLVGLNPVCLRDRCKQKKFCPRLEYSTWHPRCSYRILSHHLWNCDALKIESIHWLLLICSLWEIQTEEVHTSQQALLLCLFLVDWNVRGLTLCNTQCLLVEVLKSKSLGT